MEAGSTTARFSILQASQCCRQRPANSLAVSWRVFHSSPPFATWVVVLIVENVRSAGSHQRRSPSFTIPANVGEERFIQSGAMDPNPVPQLPNPKRVQLLSKTTTRVVLAPSYQASEPSTPAAIEVKEQPQKVHACRPRAACARSRNVLCRCCDARGL